MKILERLTVLEAVAIIYFFFSALVILSLTDAMDDLGDQLDACQSRPAPVATWAATLADRMEGTPPKSVTVVFQDGTYDHMIMEGE